MRKISFWIFILICTVSLARAQAEFDSGSNKVFAPLYLFTSGSGQIYVIQKGRLVANEDLLEVGSKYTLWPNPDPGYRFVNWSPVNVFITTTYIIGLDGSTNEISNVIPSVQPQTIRNPLLKSEVQPEFTIAETALLKIVSAQGWQANFVPIRQR